MREKGKVFRCFDPGNHLTQQTGSVRFPMLLVPLYLPGFFIRPPNASKEEAMWLIGNKGRDVEDSEEETGK